MIHKTTNDPDDWEMLSIHDLLNRADELTSNSNAYDEVKEKETFFHRPSLTIQVYTGRDRYEVDLEECRTSAELLDKIFQISGKAWCTPEVLKGFMDCLTQACRSVFGGDPQAVFCPFGNDKSVNWSKAHCG